MKESKLVVRAKSLALEYEKTDLNIRELDKDKLTIDYLVVATMKLSEESVIGDNANDFDGEELSAIVKMVKHDALFGADRASFRTLLIKNYTIDHRPNKEDQDRMELVYHLCKREFTSEGVLTLPFLLSQIIQNPSMEIKNILNKSEEKTEESFGKVEKLIELTNEKNQLKRNLLEQVKGQNLAVNTFVDGINAARMFGETTGNRPKAIFVFAGPPGVGKTFLAETGAMFLELAVKRFDMSEYTSAYDVENLIGTDAVYRNSQTGQLTGFIEECNKNKKECILIFDEIEKAHLSIIQLFLQILDSGRLTDAKTRKTVSFSNSYIIFTTNAGRSLYENKDVVSDNASKTVIIDALRDDKNPTTGQQYFPEAILSRMNSGYVVMFNHLLPNDLMDISQNVMKKSIEKIETQYGTKIIVENEIPLVLLLHMGGLCDARSLRAESERFVLEGVIGLLDSVSISDVKRELFKNNKIVFAVEDDEKEDLAKIISGVAENLTIMCVSENEKMYCDYSFEDEGYAFTNILYDRYENALDDLSKNKVYPAAIIVEVPEKTSRTGAFIPNDPFRAKMYGGFNAFLERIRIDYADVPVYGVIRKEATLGTNMVSKLVEKGFSDVVIIDSGSLNGEIVSKVAEIHRINKSYKSTFEFAKKRQQLSYQIVPHKEADCIKMLLRNLRVDTMISGSDAEHVVSRANAEKVTFIDIIGQDEVKKELREFIDFLSNPRKYVVERGEQPKGILLYGPPGTGKTFLAKALSSEADVPFFAYNGGDFVSKYVGSGPEAIRDAFSKARKYAPSIIFIDEIDAIARKRTGNENLHSQEETLNMILSEMDGFGSDTNRPVFLVAATNYGIDPNENMAIDPALVRRFTRTVFVDLPGKDDREKFVRNALGSDMNKVSDIEIENIAKRSVGMNYGNLKNVIEKAKRDSRKKGSALDYNLLSEALEIIQFGEKNNTNIDERERTAWHEAGHAFINYKNGEKPEYITITPRGNMGGYVMPRSDEDKGVWTKEELINRVVAILGGRAAEIVRFGEMDGFSTGPSNDIEQAGKLVLKYICEFGMDNEVGIVYIPDNSQVPEEILKRVNAILNDCMDKAVTRIRNNRLQIESIVSILLEKNSLTSSDLDGLLEE